MYPIPSQCWWKLSETQFFSDFLFEKHNPVEGYKQMSMYVCVWSHVVHIHPKCLKFWSTLLEETGDYPFNSLHGKWQFLGKMIKEYEAKKKVGRCKYSRRVVGTCLANIIPPWIWRCLWCLATYSNLCFVGISFHILNIHFCTRKKKRREKKKGKL